MDGEAFFGLESHHWARLHQRLVPNPLSLRDFASSVASGTIGDHFLAPHVKRLASEVRNVLFERGDWEEIELLSLSGKKADIVKGMQLALQRLSATSERNQQGVSSTRNSDANPTLNISSNAKPLTPAASAAAPQPIAPVMMKPPVSLVPQPLPEAKGLVNDLNQYVSPFSSVLHVIKIISLHYGSTPIKFEIPPPFVAGVQNRRLRIQLLPYTQVPTSKLTPNGAGIYPHRWAAVKDLVVYVNGSAVQAPWKRSWPDRKVEVTKSLLPLDVTQLISSGVKVPQRMQIDIFNREYTCTTAICVVEPLTLIEVEERLLQSLGVSPTQPQLLSIEAESRNPALVNNDLRMQNLYAQIMQDEDDDVVADDSLNILAHCPLTRGPLSIPVRSSTCRHAQCVDLANYLHHGQRGGYWNCVVCDCAMRVGDIQVDTVLWRHLLADGCRGEDVTHLQLMKNEEDTDFHWVSVRSASSVACSVVDSSDDDREDASPPLKPTFEPVPLATLMDSPVWMGGLKRMLNDSDSVKLQPAKRPNVEGSADCPIEL